MEEKHAYVHSWLGKLFSGDNAPPPYEVNSQTISFLYHMAKDFEVKEAQAKLLLEDLEQKAKEYASETLRIRSETEWLGFSVEQLTPSTSACVKNLAETALVLDIKDCSDTSLCLALSKINREQITDSAERNEITEKAYKLQEEVRDVLLKQATQHRVLSELAKEMTVVQATSEKQRRETTFLKQKSEQYQSQITSMKEELGQLGYDPSLSHAALLQQTDEVQDIQRQLSPLKAQLVSFKDLPPDLDLARVKVEEARRKLERLESELAQRIDLVHVEN